MTEIHNFYTIEYIYNYYCFDSKFVFDITMIYVYIMCTDT